MIAENKVAIFLRQNWLLFPILVVMASSGLYLALYIQAGLRISYIGLPNDFHYWLIFPYRETYLAAILAGFLFVFCGFIFIARLRRPDGVFLKSPIAICWSILSVFILLVLSSFILVLSAFGNVDHLDSAVYQQHILHLAYKNNMEYGFRYYLFDCNRQTFECKIVASFFPYNLIVFDDDARRSRLNIDANGLATVAYNEQVIYEYSLSPK